MLCFVDLALPAHLDQLASPSATFELLIYVVTYLLHCYGLLQGLDEPFLEQWHQKLHQATSPEDVIIAEAYLAFLQSANHDDW
jgi:hypothetical protein